MCVCVPVCVPVRVCACVRACVCVTVGVSIRVNWFVYDLWSVANIHNNNCHVARRVPGITSAVPGSTEWYRQPFNEY